MSRDPKDPRNYNNSRTSGGGPPAGTKQHSSSHASGSNSRQSSGAQSKHASLPTPKVQLSPRQAQERFESNKAKGIFPDTVLDSEKMRALPDFESAPSNADGGYLGNDPYKVYGPNPGGKPPAKDAHRKAANLTSAVDVLQSLLENSKSQLGDGFVRWRLEQNWSEVVGDTLAQQTLPVAYQNKILHLWVRHPAWQQQLRFFTDAIKDKVNAYIGRNFVEQVRFTLNRRAASREIGSTEK